MSYAAKAKGFRNITVEGARYRWRFVPGKDDSAVTLQGSESGFQQAIATLRGFRDPWLAFPDRPGKSALISPQVVRQMIRHALSAGWQPRRRAAAFQFDFEVNK